MRFFSVLIIGVVFFVLASGSSAQNYAFLDDKEIENKVEGLLLKRDVGELANELANDKSGQTISDALIKLSVFARAGHRRRVHEALREIGKIYAASSNQTQILKVARRAVSYDDLTAQKIFYEQIAVGGDDNIRTFTDLWQKSGDVRELENWLKVRAQASETWWLALVELKKSLGTANEIADELAFKIRQSPADSSLVQKYLQVVSIYMPTSIGPVTVTHRQDAAWLADVVKTDTAYEAYELGTLLKENYPFVAARLFEKSLSLSFTEKDAALFGQRAFRYASLPPVVKNPEKQLRFWTKKALAETYRKTNQPQLAQPIVEELTPMDASDIEANPFALAGAVQASSGQRVIESKILQDEAANENSPAYWLNRAAYYEGRKEPDSVWQTFQRALEKFPYQPNDTKASFSRAQILYDLKWYGARHKEVETTRILRAEFIQARTNKDATYLFYLAQVISDDFESLTDEFFANSNLVTQILAAREKWGDVEQSVIEFAMESEKWDGKKRAAVWEQLSELARRDIRNRAFSLTEAMEANNRKAVSLLEECLKIAPKEYEGDLNFDRQDIENALFEVYIAVGDWQKAEKMFAAGFRYRGDELAKIAVAAAKGGKTADAVRVWKTYANFDRRNVNNLYELAGTAAKIPLRDFYTQLKKRDPLSDAPDKALLFLQ